MCGFAMDREGAEALLQYHPPGAFLVRICQEPGSFSISCRVNPQPANDADVEAGSGEYNKEGDEQDNKLPKMRSKTYFDKALPQS